MNDGIGIEKEGGKKKIIFILTPSVWPAVEVSLPYRARF